MKLHVEVTHEDGPPYAVIDDEPDQQRWNLLFDFLRDVDRNEDLYLADLDRAEAGTPVLNIGTLVAPTSKAQYTAKSVPLPPKLFSHNDQQSYWQASLPEGATSGWGGRVGDLFASGNGNATFTSISATGNAVFLAGRTAMQYQVSTTGPVPVNGIRANLFGSSAASTALRALMTRRVEYDAAAFSAPMWGIPNLTDVAKKYVRFMVSLGAGGQFALGIAALAVLLEHDAA